MKVKEKKQKHCYWWIRKKRKKTSANISSKQNILIHSKSKYFVLISCKTTQRHVLKWASPLAKSTNHSRRYIYFPDHHSVQTNANHKIDLPNQRYWLSMTNRWDGEHIRSLLSRIYIDFFFLFCGTNLTSSVCFFSLSKTKRKKSQKRAVTLAVVWVFYVWCALSFRHHGLKEEHIEHLLIQNEYEMRVLLVLWWWLF